MVDGTKINKQQVVRQGSTRRPLGRYVEVDTIKGGNDEVSGRSETDREKERKGEESIETNEKERRNTRERHARATTRSEARDSTDLCVRKVE